MFKKYIPYIVAIVVFIVVTAAYFAPQYEGKDVRMHDDIQAKGMRGGIPEHIEKYGEHPQWVPNMFGGMPAYLVDMNYNGRLVKNTTDGLYFMGRPAAYYFILMAGFFFMLLCFGVNPWLSIAGGIAYGLSSYFVIIYGAGHITKLIALAFAAPMIGGVYLAYTRKLWLGAVIAGIFASANIAASHPQITYYFLFVIGGLVIAEFVRYFKNKQLHEFWKRTAVLAFAATLAVGSNAVQLWYIRDYAKDSTRSRSELKAEITENSTSGLDKDYITAWSYGKGETFNLFIPNLYGGSSMNGFSEEGDVANIFKEYGMSQKEASNLATQLPGYWGPQPMTSGPVYVGAVIIFLFVLGLMLVRGANLWWIVAMTLFSFFLAWGKNMMWFTDIFIDYVPGYNKMRTVSMILVIAQWSIPLLGFLGLKKLWDSPSSNEEFKKAFKWSVIITAGTALLFMFLGNSFMTFTGEGDLSLPSMFGMKSEDFDPILAAIQSERASMLRADALRSLIFVVLTAGAVLLFQMGKIKKLGFVAVLTALILTDMIPIDKRYLSYDDFIPQRQARGVEPTDADREIMADSDPNFRVANFTVNPFSDATTSYFHKSVGGYHAAKMRRYQDVIDKYLSKSYQPVYDMLNTKYFIMAGQSGAPEAQLNTSALGNGWIVDTVKLVNTPDEEIAEIGKVNLRATAVIDDNYKEYLNGVAMINAPDSTNGITLTDYKINHLTYKSKASKASVAVFSEIYYPKGWTAYIDGKETPHFGADYILRAVVVPAGEHTVEFKFKAPAFGTLEAITYSSSALLLLALIGVVIIEVKKSKRIGKE